jgi:hypothetical protein
MALKEIPLAMQQRLGRKAHNMRTKYFGEEYVFEFIWQHCDRDGLWTEDAASLGEEFRVSEDDTRSMLGELCDRNLIQRVGRREYMVVNWPERDEPSEEDEEP